MSNLSQFFGGGGGDSVGDVVELGIGGRNTLVRDNKVYIPVGAIAGNAPVDFPVAYANKYLRCLGPSQSSPSHPANLDIEKRNSAFYSVEGDTGSAVTFRKRSSLTGANTRVSTVVAGATNNFARGVCVNGSTVLVGVAGSTSSARLYVSTNDGVSFSAATGGPSDTNTWDIAVNDAGTLWVAARSTGPTAGFIYTSTDGVTWTSRTPSGANGTAIRKLLWVQSIGAFVVLTNTGLNTTTDGFTFTNATPAGYSNFRMAKRGFFGDGKYYISASTPSGNRIITTTDFSTFTTSGVEVALSDDSTPLVSGSAVISTGNPLFYVSATNSQYYFAVSNLALTETNPVQEATGNADETRTGVTLSVNLAVDDYVFTTLASTSPANTSRRVYLSSQFSSPDYVGLGSFMYRTAPEFSLAGKHVRIK